MTDIGLEARVRLSTATPGDYFQLLKPRVMSLVVFTALVGIVIAPHAPHALIDAISLLAIALGAGASGALNQWWDADIDAVMSRTRNRPIPAGRIGADEALAFGLTLSVFAVTLLGLAANWFAAFLLAFTIAYYVVVYSMWLKRRTVENIVIGGAAGALPPVVGWAAATGSLSFEPLVLFAIIFLWTPPHFWALALLKSDDYARAGVPMLPVVLGPDVTRRRILLYALVVAPVGLAPWALGFAGPVFGIVAAVGGVAFVGFALAVHLKREGVPARRAAGRMFGFSILWLAALFATLAAERLFS
ncbi:MAG: heme o synthase [Hyphomicrobiales bacterium]|nr:heme o synthase [Hyphomicrobiales bacterium]